MNNKPRSLAQTVVTRPLPFTLDFIALSEADPQRYPFFLESTATAPGTGRYDILFGFPQHAIVPRRGDDMMFLAELDRLWGQEAGSGCFDGPGPFRGGWFLYLGYELAEQIEPVLRLPADPSSRLPLAAAYRVPVALVRDHRRRESFAMAEPEFAMLLDTVERDVAAIQRGNRPACAPVPRLVDLQEPAPGIFLEAVHRVQRYIAAGDIFQANISRPWVARFDREDGALAVYRRLRQTNPAPFAGYAFIGGEWVISSSPERLVRRRANRIETRPIAGTRPREADPWQDRRRRRNLLANIKERAEHVMLIDLARNDLGRICMPGTIRVSELMTVESYAHVHHIVSNVAGDCRSGITPGEVIAAVFPGGTITGCPKVRCMEIIAELECLGRGAYTGALGYLNHDGDLDLNILIRTFTIRGGQAHFRAGAGIVADSRAEWELRETRQKARGLIRALEDTGSPLCPGSAGE